MKKQSLTSFIIILIGFTAGGCATVFKGYHDTVLIYHMPANTRIYDQDSIEIPIHSKTITKTFTFPSGVSIDSTIIVNRYISLRSNTDHLLFFTSPGEVKRYKAYPKLNAGWFLLDMMTGTFLVDLYTGNWNHFDNINYRTIQ